MFSLEQAFNHTRAPPCPTPFLLYVVCAHLYMLSFGHYFIILIAMFVTSSPHIARAIKRTFREDGSVFSEGGVAVLPPKAYWILDRERKKPTPVPVTANNELPATNIAWEFSSDKKTRAARKFLEESLRNDQTNQVCCVVPPCPITALWVVKAVKSVGRPGVHLAIAKSISPEGIVAAINESQSIESRDLSARLTQIEFTLMLETALENLVGDWIESHLNDVSTPFSKSAFSLQHLYLLASSIEEASEEESSNHRGNHSVFVDFEARDGQQFKGVYAGHDSELADRVYTQRYASHFAKHGLALEAKCECRPADLSDLNKKTSWVNIVKKAEVEYGIGARKCHAILLFLFNVGRITWPVMHDEPPSIWSSTGISTTHSFPDRWLRSLTSDQRMNLGLTKDITDGDIQAVFDMIERAHASEIYLVESPDGLFRVIDTDSPPQGTVAMKRKTVGPAVSNSKKGFSWMLRKSFRTYRSGTGVFTESVDALFSLGKTSLAKVTSNSISVPATVQEYIAALPLEVRSPEFIDAIQQYRTRVIYQGERAEPLGKIYKDWMQLIHARMRAMDLNVIASGSNKTSCLCDKNGEMIKQKSAKGSEWACTLCDKRRPDMNGLPLPILEGENGKCPKCRAGHLEPRLSKQGIKKGLAFLKCTTPGVKNSCDFTKWIEL